MSRKRALAATVPALMVLITAAAPAEAGIFGRKKKPEAPAATAPKKGDKAAADAQPRRRATPAERTMAQRLDPLARAAFWTHEFDTDPSDVEAGLALSAALRAMNRYDEAVEITGRVLALKPDHLEALLELARGHIARQQGFYAIEPARKAMAVAPKDWRAASLLGVAYQQVGRMAEAGQAWEKALALSPENPAVLTNVALAHAAAGELPQAEALLRRAAARPDAGLRVRQNLALVLGLQNKFAEAERLTREDLPPELAEASLAWLRSASAAKPGRSWDAMKAAGGE